MPIQMKTGPQAATYAFNSSRLDTILKAKTLNEAQRMGVFDKIIDRFRGGQKREAIRQLYDSISVPSQDQTEPAGMLQRFHRLRDMASPQDRALFRTECAPPDDRGEWGFSFTIDDRTVYASPPGMRNDGGTPFQAFDAAAHTDRLADMASRLAESVAQKSDAIIGGRTREGYALGAIDFASDNPEVRQNLKENISNPLFCKANFRGIEAGETNSTFRAIFETPEGNRHELVLSNRASTEGEFRGSVLKDALSQGSYENLGELFGSSFETSADRQINGLANLSFRLLNEELNREQGTETTLSERLDDLAALEFNAHPERARMAFDALSGVQMGKTTLLDVLLKGRAEKMAMNAVLGDAKSPTYEPVGTLLRACAFAERLLDRMGGDPEGKKLQGEVQQKLRQLEQQIGTAGLAELLTAFKARPELAGSLSLIEERIRRVITDKDLDPNDPETADWIANTSNVRNGARVLSVIAVELEQIVHGSNEEERPISAIPDYPPAFSRFVELHIYQGMDVKQAQQRATEPEVVAPPIDPARFA